MILGLKMLLGGVTVLIISLFSKSKSFYIAGLIPLFPTFALIAHIIVFNDRDIGDLKQTILFGMFSLVPYFVYLATLYIAIDKFENFYGSLTMSVVAWVFAAIVLIIAWRQYIVPVS